MIAWGSTPPNCAVNGLTALVRREEWRSHPDGARIRKLIRPLLDSRDETIRMLASMALPYIVEPENLTGELTARLSKEESDSVLEVLLATLESQAASDPMGIDGCLAHLASRPRWSMLDGSAEDRSRPVGERRSETGDLLSNVLLFLGLVQTTPFVSALLTSLQRDPQNCPATVGRLVAFARPYMNPPGEDNTVTQARAFEMLTNLTDGVMRVVAASEEAITSGTTLSSEQRGDLEAAGWIANCIAREIYHASGAFQNPSDKAGPDERVVAPSFCALSFPVIETLASVRGAAIAHHLVLTLVFLSRREPRRAFLSVAKIATPGSGYEYESLGESEVLDLVDEYLAERRDLILNDAECLSGLRRILETFVAVGSDRAIRRVQDLGELFR